MSVKELHEVDEAGKIVREYLVSVDKHDNQGRVDIEIPSHATKSRFQATLDVFLPAGFPHSVTSDYVEQVSKFSTSCEHC